MSSAPVPCITGCRTYLEELVCEFDRIHLICDVHVGKLKVDTALRAEAMAPHHLYMHVLKFIQS